MSKKTFNKPKRAQFVYFLLVFISGGALFFIKTQPEKEQNFGLMILLLIILMFSLLKSTKNWAYDNPKPKDDEENADDKPVYKNKEIPSLEEMTKNIKKKDKKSS
ncbi:MAG TPA: hypothetical protein ENK64_02260 [Flavobacteriales bacterium]|jgi:hypothetical protein|nr:hypothetical protein [Flavobacteriales bacterium]